MHQYFSTDADDVEQGDGQALERLWPLVYDELRRLAGAQMARERPGQTLDATALVHEAYLRLADEPGRAFANRRHFFAAAAEAMRRILVENARRHGARKRGGGRERIELPELDEPAPEDPVDLLALDEVLKQLESQHPQQARRSSSASARGAAWKRPPSCSASPAPRPGAIGRLPGPGY